MQTSLGRIAFNGLLWIAEIYARLREPRATPEGSFDPSRLLDAM